MFKHMADPLVFLPGFLDEKNFPRIQIRNRYSKDLLQYPHGPVPEIRLAIPWCTAAGGTLHKSPVPIYPLGLDKTNFTRTLNSLGTKGATIPTTHTRFRT